MKKGLFVSEFFCRLGANNSPLQHSFNSHLAIFALLSFSIVFNIQLIVNSSEVLWIVITLVSIISTCTLIISQVTIDRNKSVHDFFARSLFFVAIIFSFIFIRYVEVYNTLSLITVLIMYILGGFVLLLSILEIPKLLNMGFHKLILPTQRILQWIVVSLALLWNMSISIWLILELLI